MVQEINIFASQKVNSISDSNKINITLTIDSRPIETMKIGKFCSKYFIWIYLVWWSGESSDQAVGRFHSEVSFSTFSVGKIRSLASKFIDLVNIIQWDNRRWNLGQIGR